MRVLVWCLSIARSSDTNWILINCYRINYLYLNVIICGISMINFSCKNTALFIARKKENSLHLCAFFYYLLHYLIFLYTPSIKKKKILFCPLTTLTDFARFERVLRVCLPLRRSLCKYDWPHGANCRSQNSLFSLTYSYTSYLSFFAPSSWVSDVS